MVNKKYDVFLICPETKTKNTLAQTTNCLPDANLITIGNMETLEGLTTMNSREIKNHIASRMVRYKEDPEKGQQNVFSCFMLDTQAEELYGGAVRSLIPSATRIFFYGIDNSVSRF